MVAALFRSMATAYQEIDISTRSTIQASKLFRRQKLVEMWNAVGLMGSSMSPEQEALILDHFNYITVMVDWDDAGRRAQEQIAFRLCRKIFVKIHELPEGLGLDKLTEKPFYIEQNIGKNSFQFQLLKTKIAPNKRQKFLFPFWRDAVSRRGLGKPSRSSCSVFGKL